VISTASCKYVFSSTFETVGSLQEGKKVWLLAKLPNQYRILDDEVKTYLVFTNSHDGSGAIKVAMTPIRIVCQNTLNLALNTAKRMWSVNHTGDINQKLNEARKTIFLSETYMKNFELEVQTLSKIHMSDSKVIEFINELIPLQDEVSIIRRKNVQTLRNDLKMRYFEAPDLKNKPKTAWRVINSVSRLCHSCRAAS
jgi:phage/plasmid-like protein (TIGR03299 family)